MIFRQWKNYYRQNEWTNAQCIYRIQSNIECTILCDNVVTYIGLWWDIQLLGTVALSCLRKRPTNMGILSKIRSAIIYISFVSCTSSLALQPNFPSEPIANILSYSMSLRCCVRCRWNVFLQVSQAENYFFLMYPTIMTILYVLS